jgi:hypothetical protein
MPGGGVPQRATIEKGPEIAILPTTRLGRWALGLAAANVVLVLGWSLMGPLGAIPGFACGLAAGGVGLVAIFRRGERAITVFAALMPFAFVLLFVLLELVVGHD